MENLMQNNLKKKHKPTKEAKLALKLEEKSQIRLNQTLKPIIYFIFALTIELIMFDTLKIEDNNGHLQVFPNYIFFDIGIWLIISSLIFISTKKWLANIIFSVSIIIQIIFFLVNSILYSTFNYLFTFDMLKLISAALKALDASFINFKLLFAGIIGLLIIIFLPILLDKFCKATLFKTNKRTHFAILLSCFFTLFIIGGVSYSTQILTISTSNEEYKYIEDDKFLYANLHNDMLAYQKFGTCGFYLKNLYNLTLKNWFSNNEHQKQELLNSIKSQETSSNQNAILKDDNLIIIMLESFEWFAIDPYNTPNLWKLKTGLGDTSLAIDKQGIVFNNYISNNKTNVSENLVMLGYMPKTSELNFGSTDTIATTYSLPNLFKNQGYTANYFHNYKPNYYNRDKINIEIGFENFYSSNDFEAVDNYKYEFDYWNKESDFVDQMMNKIAPTDKKFISFYLTVSSHGSYNVTNERFKDYYSIYDSNLEDFKVWAGENGYNYPEDERYQKCLRQYKSAAIDTEKMIEKLFKHLNNTGLIDNTSIILYSDHNAYYHELSYEMKNITSDIAENKNSFIVPFMIYSSKLESKNIDTFCNTYDIYPTICELYGLNYSKFFTFGHNMLSDDIKNSLYYSHLTGFYNNNCYSRYLQNIKRYDNCTEEDIINFKKQLNRYYEKQMKIEMVYKSKWKT